MKHNTSIHFFSFKFHLCKQKFTICIYNIQQFFYPFLPYYKNANRANKSNYDGFVSQLFQSLKEKENQGKK